MVKINGSAPCVEALKEGKKKLVSKDKQTKLIIEGDELKV